MNLKGRYVGRFAFFEGDSSRVVAVAKMQQKCAGRHEDRLALRLVVLQAQPFTRVDVDLLARVERRLAPDNLVAPRLVHPSCHGHESSAVCRDELASLPVLPFGVHSYLEFP